jgi:uncharacterized protein (TIGR03118 family)
MTLTIPSGLWAQQAGYSQTNLVSNIAGVATTTDSQLLNPWGISVLPGQDFWIADNNSGVSTLYDQNGNKDTGLIVTIPGASSNPNGNCSPGCPTGTVANASGSYFSGGSFIFDTEDGLVVYWNGSSNTAIVGKDNSASGAVYKGLALLGTNLLAANFNSGKVDVYDSNYTLTALSGSFTDPNLPAGFAPHGIHVIGNQVYVAYAMQDTPKHDAVPGAGAGQVDIFDANGNFVSTFVAAAANNNLNAPWDRQESPRNAREARVVELTSYGLTGVTAVLVISFCFAYGGELPRTRKKSSYDLINNAHLNDSPLVETEARSLRFRGNEGKQQETAPASSLQKTSRVETGHGAIYGGSFRNDRGTLEALHG